MSQLFSKSGIDNVIVKVKPIVDEVIIGDDMDKKIHVKIRDSDFKKANEIIEEQIKENISQIGEDYYLYSFSDEELLEIINKPDEWSRQDYYVARKILGERGSALSEKQISEIRWKRMKEIGTQERGSIFWIVIGYILSLGGVPGFLFGLSYLNARKILPDGSKVFVYDEGTRNHGRNILIISCIFILVDILAALGLYGRSA